MPKVRASVTDKLSKFVRDFGSNVFSSDGAVLFCKVCQKSVNFEKKYFITQHIEGANHKKAVALKVGAPKTPLLKVFTSTSNRQSEFSFDLCKAFVSAGIPLWKIENPSLRTLFEKYVKEKLPCESTLRKNYLDLAYQGTMEEIRGFMKDKKIWISIDETTDAVGRHIANVIVGSLEPNQPSKIYLLNSDCLEKANGSTIAQLFTNSLSLLWPEKIQHDNVFMFVTDAAPYMKKAGNALKVLFPRMLHLTCLAHGIHRVAEEIREQFSDVDMLISSVKKIFLKAPSRIRLFKEAAPELVLPPQPVLTRWGTWISAACYYATNLKTIKDIIANLDEDSAASIKAVKRLLEKKSLKNDLAFISANYSLLPSTITSLESRDLTLIDAVNIVNNTIKDICSISGNKGRIIKDKCESVIAANKDFAAIKSLANILSGNTDKENTVNYDINEIICFKFAPITSVDVERSFSKLKYIFSDRRQALTAENLKKHLIVSCNSNE